MVRTFYGVICLLLCSIDYCAAQQVAIAAEKMNVIYVGILNPITVMVENMPCKDIVVETSSGKISKLDEFCQYEVVPAEMGKIIISIYRKQDKKLLGKKEFRTKRVPEPLATVGGKRSGIIKKAALKAQLGVAARIDGFDFDGGFTINSFKATITRNHNVVFERYCTGARFDNDIVNALSTVKAGDLFECTDVRFSGMGYNNAVTNSVELQVID